MTQGEVVELFKAITLSYPTFRVSEDLASLQISQWQRQLSDIPFEVAMENFDAYCRESSYPPTPADIRRGYSAEKSTVPGVDETQQYLAEMDNLRERAVPMPDHLRKELRRIARRI